jgi:glyoxylase-like metal-dependent hydrolase (beta-lactamase superfamily II)
MFMKILTAHKLCMVVLLTLVLAIASAAQYVQQKEQPGKAAETNKLNAQLVKNGLYLISGGGGNSLLRLSANGLIVVNGKLPGNYDALTKWARKIVDQPIRVLIVTDHLESNNGNNARFLEAGAQIIAQENVKQNLAAYSGTIAQPTITYADDYELRLGGVEVQLMHFGNAFSNADTVVYFPNLKVVAVGELYTSVPNPNFSTGGSLVGWSSVLAQVLKLDFDTVVPGTGPPITRSELEALKTKIDTLVSRATGLVNQGVPKDQLMAQLKTDDLGWRLSLTPEQVASFYAEVSRDPNRENSKAKLSGVHQ